MTFHFVSLVFIWLPLLTASSTVTSGHNNNFNNAITGTQVTRNKFTHDQLTTQEMSSSNPLSAVSDPTITQSIKAYVNPTEELATKSSTEPSLQTTWTTSLKTVFPGIQTAATPTNSTSAQLDGSTVEMRPTTVQIKGTSSEVATATSHASIPTTTTRVPLTLSSSAQSQFTSNKVTRLSARPTQSTNLISTKTTFAKPAENNSTSSGHVTLGDATQSAGSYKTSVAMTKTPFIHITKAKKRQDPPENNAKSNKSTDHSKVVAGLIGGALVLMMFGFLLIYIKKRKLQKHQITTTDWAGPSPFLEAGADNVQVTRRSSNRISLSSFLPQRLTKRLSLLPETDEQLEDMTPGTTFGAKHQGSTFGQEEDGNDEQVSNGTAVVVLEMKNTGDDPDTIENSVSVTSKKSE
ncbi:cell wall protein DAN4 [Plectropomus leopardus]|uniref:cell wall protein DAN4 n=1 Tax=Plectropomus leopardus TaxID=160734 RepID=UPI001C4BF692|nr:cell wall protein DAN4 [Plectropomus leopardus]